MDPLCVYMKMMIRTCNFLKWWVVKIQFFLYPTASESMVYILLDRIFQWPQAERKYLIYTFSRVDSYSHPHRVSIFSLCFQRDIHIFQRMHAEGKYLILYALIRVKYRRRQIPYFTLHNHTWLCSYSSTVKIWKESVEFLRITYFVGVCFKNINSLRYPWPVWKFILPTSTRYLEI